MNQHAGLKDKPFGEDRIVWDKNEPGPLHAIGSAAAMHESIFTDSRSWRKWGGVDTDLLRATQAYNAAPVNLCEIYFVQANNMRQPNGPVHKACHEQAQSNACAMTNNSGVATIQQSVGFEGSAVKTSGKSFSK